MNKVRRQIPLCDTGDTIASLLPALNYIIGGPDAGPMTVKGIPVSVNVDLAPALHKTAITAASIIGGAIALTGLAILIKK